ncbi:putative RING-H2 finger protein ATL61 [Mangifera indica]|uniref:putative RING-H2 finger protein ATL61 n=1 Tax=Mangifera indica TaxID=29780 RepID=UPI001CFA00CF|nr:putative RING-H2 finger protein ATL61 [Mangifera indica]
MMISITAAVMFMAILIVCSFYLYNRWFGQSQSGGDNQGHKENGSTQFHAEIDCTVCLNKVLQGEPLRVLPTCYHGFHAHCIDAWLKLHSTCPLCRADVPCSQPAPKLEGLVSWLLSSLTNVSNWMEVSFNDEIKTALCADFGSLS